MTAEAIAKVAEDIRLNRVRPAVGGVNWADAAQEPLDRIPIIDATEIYRSLASRPNFPINLYEDHPCITPPWPEFMVGFVNKHGNVEIALCTEWTREWETAEPIDWNLVKWRVISFLFIGGRSEAVGLVDEVSAKQWLQGESLDTPEVYLGKSRPVPTTGPVHSWQLAIDADGKPLDLHWMQLADGPRGLWDMAHLVLLQSLNFLNCRNVQIVEPHRPRAQARRVARTGQRVYEINVFPVGRAPAARAPSGAAGGGVPLTSVRGHFATYGPQYGKGLLFGKHAGRYWIPQHARGSAEFGEVDHDYKLRTQA